MFNKLKRFFGISTNVVEDITEKVVEQETKQKRKYSFNYDNIDVNKFNIDNCYCGRRTLVKSHTKKVDKKGNITYSFHIICPNCGHEIYGTASKLEIAKIVAIRKWNKSVKMCKYWVQRGVKQIVSPARSVGRPRKVSQ